ncbi:hypothetical protein B7494_g1513 [Chlorociboria aeruginascens]|nr:hypothetical protein B7494_g1513 [Chlorociboria aeruginascens]
MRWPPWSSNSEKEKYDRKSKPPWTDSLNATDWSHYTDPRTIIPTVLLTTTLLVSIRLYRSYLHRIPEATHIRPGFFRKRSLFGRVTSVGDADNFHLFHTPGGRIAGWEWLPGRKIPAKKSALKGNTIHVRIAGIDAPEGAHFGKPAQPHSAEALAWLKSYILNRRVRAYIYKRDQYERVVATVYVRRFLFRKDVGQEMLRAGFATVYEANSGAEFGNFEAMYRQIEARAKKKKRGMWSGKMKDYESPRDYKLRTAVQSYVQRPTAAQHPVTHHTATIAFPFSPLCLSASSGNARVLAKDHGNPAAPPIIKERSALGRDRPSLPVLADLLDFPVIHLHQQYQNPPLSLPHAHYQGFTTSDQNYHCGRNRNRLPHGPLAYQSIP